MLQQPEPGFPAESLLLRNSPIGLIDAGYRAPQTAIRSMGMVSLDFAPVYLATPQSRSSARSRARAADSPVMTPDLASRGVYTGGELGVYYGRSAGKWSGDEFGSYIFGTVGNEHVQITAGAAYQESNFRFPRGR